jgi:uncharacterized membrane protein required for colicin V production
MKGFDIILLFISLGFLVIWVDQFFYKSVDLKDSYFFLMFSLSGFLYFLYRKGQSQLTQDSSKKEDLNKKSKKKK